MQPRSESWRTAMRDLEGGIGTNVTVVIDLPDAGILLASQSLPSTMVPAGRKVLVALAAFGTGVTQASRALAEDRSVRVGSTSCTCTLTTEILGRAIPDTTRVLVALENHPATAWLALMGEPLTAGQAILSGRVKGLRLERGQITFAIEDSVALDHLDISVPFGGALFPAAGAEGRGRVVPLILGPVRDLVPIPVEGFARGTLAVALPSTPGTTEIVLNEIEAVFPATDPTQIRIGGVEVATYTGRRPGLLPDGTPVLILSNVVRTTPIGFAVGTGLETYPPVRTRYVIGRGLPGVQLRAVRIAGATVAAGFTFLAAIPGITPALAGIDFDDTPNGRVTVDVDTLGPAESLINGGFEAGDLTGWTVENGTITVTTGETFDGTHKTSFDTAPAGQEAILRQDLAVRSGLRYVLAAHYQTPRGGTNLLTNGDWTGGTTAPWTVAVSAGTSVVYPGSFSHVHTLEAHIAPPTAGFYTRSYTVRLTQEITTTPAQELELESLVAIPFALSSQVLYGRNPELPVQSYLPLHYLPAGTDRGANFLGYVLIEALDVSEPIQVFPYYVLPEALRQLRPTSGVPISIGLLYQALGRFTPSGTSYRVSLVFAGESAGSPPNLILYPLSVHQATTLAQASGVLEVGDGTDLTRYGTVPLPSWGGSWRPVQLGFISQATTLSVRVRATFPTPAAPLWLDAVALQPPGRNPVAILRSLFTTLLPTLPLDTDAWDTAEAARDGWAFGGALLDVDRTDEAVARLAQQCACVVQKNARGLYTIVAEDIDASPVATFQKRLHILEGTVSQAYATIETLFTEFYLTYARVQEVATPRASANYAGVVFCTPEATSHPDVTLAQRCKQALGQARQARRFTFSADAIVEIGTAHLLLEHFVRRFTALRREARFAGTLAAVPIEPADVVQVVHPMLTSRGPFAGEVVSAQLTLSAQAPGPQVALALREWGRPAGVAEPWELPLFPEVRRVFEPWEDTAPAQWLYYLEIPGDPPLEAITAMISTAPETLTLTAGAPHALQGSYAAYESTTLFGDPHFAGALLPPDGHGTALVQFDGSIYVAGEEYDSSGIGRLWSVTPFDTKWSITGALIWSLRVHGGLLYGGTSDGRIYQWDGIAAAPTLVLTVASGGIVRTLVEDGADLVALVESASGLLVTRSATGASGDWSTPTLVLTGAARTAPAIQHSGQWWVAALVGSAVNVFSSADLETWTLNETFSSPAGHYPTALASFGGQLFLARGNTLDLMAYDGAAWSLSIDLGTIPHPIFLDTDINPSITALGTARGKLFAATGLFEDVSSQSVRLYAYPEDDPIP